MTRLLHPLDPSHARPAPPWQPAAVVGALAGGLLWCYWQTLVTMADRWARDPQYSHGFLVPVFAGVVLWSRRDQLAGVTWRPDPLGLPFIVVGLFLRWCAVRIDFEALDAASLLPTLAGVVLLVGGRSLLRWSWPAIAFLAFMMPLPFFIEVSLAHPLRRVATVVSTYALQTFGSPATAEGNIILIGDIRLGVAEACSGLGMLMTFFALSTLLALVVHAPLADRIVLVLSAIPIAVLANVARITATGLAYQAWGQDSEVAYAIMHDLAGWLMMPLALLLLWLETRYLAHLWTEVPDDRPLPLTLTGNRPTSPDLKRT